MNAATAAMWAFALGLGVGLTIRVYERADEFAAWFEDKFGHPIGDGPRKRVHPEQWEAEQRQAERAERDREFVRVYGDGR